MKSLLSFILAGLLGMLSAGDAAAIDPTGPGGNGTNGAVRAIVADGSGNLYVGGHFPGGIAKWDGTTWTVPGGGVEGEVHALAYQAATGTLYVGGFFQKAGTLTGVNNIARLNTATNTWSKVGTGVNNLVRTLLLQGNNLYVGGDFNLAGGKTVNYIARVRVTNNKWFNLGTGMDRGVYALAFRKGVLYAGGYFTRAGTATAHYIAQWDGTAWSRLGPAANPGMNHRVEALAFDKSGRLYAGGWFTKAGPAGVQYIARWDGAAWSALPSQVNYGVQALVIRGNRLYAGGSFEVAGTAPAHYVAHFNINKNTWKTLDGGLNGFVLALYLHEPTDRLYAGGIFDYDYGRTVEAHNVAYWDGSDWNPLVGTPPALLAGPADAGEALMLRQAGAVGVELPAEVTLAGAYPNPFNPSTTIRYALPEAADVRLEVFDLMGRRVAVLAAGAHTAGWHEAVFDGQGLASGTYVYRLQAGPVVQARTVALAK